MNRIHPAVPLAFSAILVLGATAAEPPQAEPHADEGSAGAPPVTLPEKSSWHGFDRFDFLMDATARTIEPGKASADEGTGIHHQVDGQLRCVVVVPKEAAPGRPWSWRGRYFDHEPQVEIELLKRGYHIGFVQSDDLAHWEAWYEFLTEQFDLSAKPAFVGMSGGGRNAFTWVATYPDRVSCIYADNPLIRRESLMKLDGLVERDVPLLHICGSLDPLTKDHTLPIESIYHRLGGRISVMIKDGVGHHPHSLRDPSIIADFITRSREPAAPVPAFVGTEFTRGSFYSVEDEYTPLPSEGLYVTRRGSLFGPTYDHYQFIPAGRTGTVDVIVPRKPASGNPWVLRPDSIPRDAVVDLALLDRGFHILRAPRPRADDVTLFQEWDALHEHLVGHGFSTRPVLEGASTAAGEIYDWAIANPDKVTCLYGENPVLRSGLPRAEPTVDLAPLAKAGVPILHVCGSLDPWLETQTRTVERRYNDLGGRITVMVKEGVGHYPLAPDDPQLVAEWIVDTVGARKGNREN